MTLPLARTIVLTDAGTVAYSVELAAYDGTPSLPPTLDNTPIGSGLSITAVPGALAAFTLLFATSSDTHADIDQLNVRFDQLEA